VLAIVDVAPGTSKEMKVSAAWPAELSSMVQRIVQTGFRIFSSLERDCDLAQQLLLSVTCISRNSGKKAHPANIFLVRFHARVPVEDPGDVSKLLADWGGGDKDALSRLISLIYPELRRIARQHLGRCFGGETLESAALANEAYLKLIRARGIQCESRAHFLALCAKTIRLIIVDHARSRRYAKRGGGVVQIALDEAPAGMQARGVEVMALEEALESLSRIDPRKGRVVELRYFGGLSVEETAEVLEISRETAKRDWKMAKAWLQRELTWKPTNAAPRRPARN
jgi:RNA polymerase sigma factor (TIGR02999 family)